MAEKDAFSADRSQRLHCKQAVLNSGEVLPLGDCLEFAFILGLTIDQTLIRSPYKPRFAPVVRLIVSKIIQKTSPSRVFDRNK